uniref:LEM domain containing 1 n=1 Tax=Mastacembelus armatus TaxID=205130 RepID=A0A3Q3N838_9TELE
MPLSEHPASLSKSRLKSDLVAHGVTLPPAKSKKEVYVKLHLKHVDQKTSAGLSGDEEEENPEEAEMPDVTALTDDDLKATLHKYGFKAGPIVASTRAVHEKKLRRLLQSDRQVRFSGAEKEVLYSDRKEEEENGQDDDDDADSGMASNALDFFFFLPSSEPMKGTFKDIIPDTEAIQRRTYATCRKPIKGTAGRPVQRAYADTPASPTTIGRREVERRLVPIHIQILVFFIVACLFYLINVCVEDNSLSPLVALLDSLTQGVDSDERALIQSNTQDTPVLSRQV